MLLSGACLAQNTVDINEEGFPQMYGGKTEWKRFLHDHLVYPATALENKTEGSVKIEFLIPQDGKEIEPKIVKSAGPELDKEALRLVKLIEWEPAYKKSSTVNIHQHIEVDFSTAKYKKWTKERGFTTPTYTDMPCDSVHGIYESVEKKPVFQNANKTFQEFIYSNLEYPEMAKRQDLEGNVVLSFVVETDGRVSNIRIQKGVGGGCDEEAIRVIGLTSWKPAIRENKYVRYRTSYTMVFSLKNSFKDNSSGSQRTWGQ
jgi:TonB family protein